MRMGIENEIGNDARLLGHPWPVLGWPNPCIAQQMTPQFCVLESHAAVAT